MVRAITTEKNLENLLHPTNNERLIVTALEALGRLPEDFDDALLWPLLNHSSPEVRLLTIKNLGKLRLVNYLDTLIAFAQNEQATLVRREAVSTIGRMRLERAVPALIAFLQDEDAKVVLQAIRALVVFKRQSRVEEALCSLENHPNELVCEAVRKELGKKKNDKDSRHRQSPEFLKNVLVHGDVRETLKCVPDESVHLTFTSPPYYNARDYTIYKSYDEYLEFLVGVFKEVHRITKEGRFFVLNTSPVIIPRMSRAHSSTRYLIPYDIHPRLQKIGWDFIEDIVWLKPEPSAKNRNGGFFQHRKPLGYKANSITESVIVYRKRTDKLIDWNMQQYSKEIIEASKVLGDYEKTNVWRIAPSNDIVHPATFPKELATRVIQFYSFVGDLVFDPFGGTGVVGQAALIKNRYFFLTEQEQRYIERATELFARLDFFGEMPLKVYELEQFQQEARASLSDDHYGTSR
jgi:DNA modification methylase